MFLSKITVNEQLNEYALMYIPKFIAQMEFDIPIQIVIGIQLCHNSKFKLILLLFQLLFWKCIMPWALYHIENSV